MDQIHSLCKLLQFRLSLIQLPFHQTFTSPPYIVHDGSGLDWKARYNGLIVRNSSYFRMRATSGDLIDESHRKRMGRMEISLK